jgi:PAS domain S-box-containing protein
MFGMPSRAGCGGSWREGIWMAAEMRGDGLSRFAGACAASETVDAVLAAALPVLAPDARAVLHVTRSAAGGTVTRATGEALPWAGSEVPLAEVSGDAPLMPVPVPAAWGELGVEQVVAHRLPGDVGALVLADPRGDGPTVDVLTLVDLAVGRLVAEERLADLRARVDNAQQLADMGDYDWHIATDTNQWSDQLYRIYGHEPQAFNASYERFLSHIHPEDRARIAEIHRIAYESGEPYQMIERIVRPTGEVRYLSSNGQVVRDEAGNPVRMRGTCIDITDRILAEQERERSAARFRSVVEASPSGIVVLDRGVVVQANGRAGELLGGDPVGRPFTAIVPGGEVSGDALDAVGLDGRALRLDVTIAAIEHEPGAAASAAFLSDASPRLASEALAATLREVQVRRRQALEINDNVVQGLTAAMYALDLGDPAAGSSFVERALSGARHLMNDWLNPPDGSRLEAGDLVRTGGSTLEAPTSEAAAEPEEPETPPARRPRIVVVDDNDDVRRLVRVQIERLGGYEVVGEAVDGVEAVEVVGSSRPDLVFLDLAMPRMDGLEALPLIRQAVPGVRVIVLSGFDEGTIGAKALAAGASRYVEKGLRLDFRGLIEDVLNQPESIPS